MNSKVNFQILLISILIRRKKQKKTRESSFKIMDFHKHCMLLLLQQRFQRTYGRRLKIIRRKVVIRIFKEWFRESKQWEIITTKCQFKWLNKLKRKRLLIINWGRNIKINGTDFHRTHLMPNLSIASRIYKWKQPWLRKLTWKLNRSLNHKEKCSSYSINQRMNSQQWFHKAKMCRK